MAKLGADLRGMTCLLDALAALALLRKREAHYSVPDPVAEALVQGRPANLLPMVRHQGNCLPSLRHAGRNRLQRTPRRMRGQRPGL